MTPYGFTIDSLKEIAKKAGNAILEVYITDFNDNIELKDDNSPLTLADKRAHGIIEAGLNSLPVKYPILSEESIIPNYKIRKSWELFWMVDPLDGTKEFINKNGDFTVNIALIKKGKVVFGCIQVPVENVCYWGLEGSGSFREKDGQVKRLKVKTFDAKTKGLKILGSRSHMNQDTRDYLGQFDNPVLLARGSSLKMMMIAEGKADLYPRMGPTMEWDTAASQIILEEAGGSMKKIDELTDLVYNKEDLLNPYFIASAKRIQR